MSTYCTESDADDTLPGTDYASSTASYRREESNTPPQPMPPQCGMFGPVAPSHTPQERDAARAMLELRDPVVHDATNTSVMTNGDPDSGSDSSPGPEAEAGDRFGSNWENAASGLAPGLTTTPAPTSGSAPNGNTPTTVNTPITSNPATTSTSTFATTTTPTNDGTPTVTNNPVTANPPTPADNLNSTNLTPATTSTENLPALPTAGPAATQGSKTITVSQYHAMMRARAARH